MSVVTVQILNAGNVPIDADDHDVPLKLYLTPQDSAKIEHASVIRAWESAAIEVVDREGSNLQLRPPLLNPDDWLRVVIRTLGVPKDVRLAGHIRGVTGIRRRRLRLHHVRPETQLQPVPSSERYTNAVMQAAVLTIRRYKVVLILFGILVWGVIFDLFFSDDSRAQSEPREFALGMIFWSVILLFAPVTTFVKYLRQLRPALRAENWTEDE